MGAKTTILYLHSSDDLYGSDKVLLEIVRGLDRERFVPVVVLPDDMQHVGLLSAELTTEGIEWMHLPIAILRRRYFSVRGLLEFAGKLVRGTLAVRRVARARDVRLIHGFTLAVAAAPVAAMVLKLPLVMHAHEILVRPRALRKGLHALGVRWADRVICVSEAVRRNVLEDEPEASERVVVVRNGIRARGEGGTSVAALRAELGVPVEGALVGMIGRVSAWKGQEVFLEAAALVLGAGVRCHFVAIGGVFDGEMIYLERLRAMQLRLDLMRDVTLVNFMKDARRMLPAFDVFVLPSTSPEPFGLVVLEAMNAGVPVIGTAHGGTVEMVIDGESGLLVPPGDAKALAGAIRGLLGDPRRAKEIGEAGRRRMLAEFELSAYLKAIDGVYGEVLRSGG